MPIVNIHILEGRSLDQKRKLVSEMTKSICDSLSVKPESVRIIISEMANEEFAVAGTLKIDQK